jgi:hypothetical protein
MTEPQLPRAAGPLAEAGGPGAATDPSTFSKLIADAMRAHADYGAGGSAAAGPEPSAPRDTSSSGGRLTANRATEAR